MKKLMSGLAASFLAAGCATVEMSAKDSLAGVDIKGGGKACDRQVVISCSDCSIWFTVPLFSGDLSWDAKKGCVRGGMTMGRGYANLKEVMAALEKIAEHENCDLVNVMTQDNSTSPLAASYQGLSGFLFGFNQVDVSAVLRPRTAK